MPDPQRPADPALVWDEPRRPVPRVARPQPPVRRPEAGPGDSRRITLREAAARFGVAAGTLRRWARDGSLDAVKDAEATPPRWMVDPESVAAVAAQRTSAPRATPVERRPRRTGPTEDGTAMLVPRDAWDRLMDQLGNLHEAGKALAEARERAARAETEATFLRERLAELRSERDGLRAAGEAPRPASAAGPGGLAAWWRRLRLRD